MGFFGGIDSLLALGCRIERRGRPPLPAFTR